MLFNSVSFIVFLPIVLVGYFLLRQPYRNLWLLLAGAVFYMWFIPSYILILLLTILVDYGAAIQMNKKEGKSRKSWLILSIVSTSLILMVFKYLDFVTVNWNALASFLHLEGRLPLLKIALPIGLSFHTFQSLSYVIEVYKKKVEPENNLLNYTLYVMFFPQLVAGPIERPQHLLPQFRQCFPFDQKVFISGLWLLLWGFFKKVAIADRLVPYVDDVYGFKYEGQGVESMLGIYFFAIQIYCDFSGYSDIALGSARMMGFTLRLNFDKPYGSRSFTDFWRRWHISLSSWFRDYIYIPLGGNKTHPIKHAVILMATFLLSGLWHGANWTFVIWGGIHGTLLLLEKWSTGIRKNIPLKIKSFLGWIITFHIVCLAWVFFRSPQLDDASRMLASLGGHWKIHVPFGGHFETSMDMLMLSIALIIWIYFDNGGANAPWQFWDQKPRWAQSLYTSVFIILILLLGAFTNSQSFIYFQF